MKIIFEHYNVSYSIEDKREDYLSDELIDMFTRLLVTAGFNSSLLKDNEELINKEDLYNFKRNTELLNKLETDPEIKAILLSRENKDE